MLTFLLIDCARIRDRTRREGLNLILSIDVNVYEVNTLPLSRIKPKPGPLVRIFILIKGYGH